MTPLESWHKRWIDKELYWLVKHLGMKGLKLTFVWHMVINLRTCISFTEAHTSGMFLHAFLHDCLQWHDLQYDNKGIGCTIWLISFSIYSSAKESAEANGREIPRGKIVLHQSKKGLLALKINIQNLNFAQTTTINIRGEYSTISATK